MVALQKARFGPLLGALAVLALTAGAVVLLRTPRRNAGHRTASRRSSGGGAARRGRRARDHRRHRGPDPERDREPAAGGRPGRQRRPGNDPGPAADGAVVGAVPPGDGRLRSVRRRGNADRDLPSAGGARPPDVRPGGAAGASRVVRDGAGVGPGADRRGLPGRADRPLGLAGPAGNQGAGRRAGLRHGGTGRRRGRDLGRPPSAGRRRAEQQQRHRRRRGDQAGPRSPGARPPKRGRRDDGRAAAAGRPARAGRAWSRRTPRAACRSLGR